MSITNSAVRTGSNLSNTLSCPRLAMTRSMTYCGKPYGLLIPSASVYAQRPRNGAFRRGRELALLPAPIYQSCHDGDRAGDGERERHGLGIMLDFLAQIVCGEPIKQCPANGPRRVGNHEVCEWHPARPGDERGERPQHCDEARHQHDADAIALEQILENLDPRLGQPDITAVAQQ